MWSSTMKSHWAPQRTIPSIIFEFPDWVLRRYRKSYRRLIPRNYALKLFSLLNRLAKLATRIEQIYCLFEADLGASGIREAIRRLCGAFQPSYLLNLNVLEKKQFSCLLEAEMRIAKELHANAFKNSLRNYDWRLSSRVKYAQLVIRPSNVRVLYNHHKPQTPFISPPYQNPHPQAPIPQSHPPRVSLPVRRRLCSSHTENTVRL